MKIQLASESDKYPGDESLSIVKQPGDAYRAPQELLKPIENRVSVYDGLQTAYMHNARMILPRKVASILNSEPQIISRIVSTFYHRDPVDLKALVSMDNFGAELHDTVEYTVRMSRCLYAQLDSQKFISPKIFNLPAAHSKNARPAELGMKVTCGLEMLTSSLLNSKAGNDVLGNYKFDTDAVFDKYRQNLAGSKFFDSTSLAAAPLSTDQLMKIVKEQYLYIAFGVKRTDSDIRRLISNAPLLDDGTIKAHETLVQPESDAWITVTDEKIDSLLGEHQGLDQDEIAEISKMNFAETDADGENEFKISEVVRMFNDFVNYENTGLEGAEFPSEAEDNEETDEDDGEIEGDFDYSYGNGDAPLPSKFDGDAKDVLKKAKSELDTFLKSMERARSAFENIQLNSVMATRDESGEENDEAEADEADEMTDYMRHMDAEIATTNLGKSVTKPSQVLATDDSDNEESDFDVNLAKQLLESFKAQQGLPGPVGNILGRLNVQIPRDEADD